MRRSLTSDQIGVIVWTVDCPTCGVKARQRCISLGGAEYSGYVHEARELGYAYPAPSAWETVRKVMHDRGDHTRCKPPCTSLDAALNQWQSTHDQYCDAREDLDKALETWLTPLYADRAVVDMIALLLGSKQDWGADELGQIAHLVSRVRPDPGDSTDYEAEFTRATGRVYQVNEEVR